MKTKGKDLKRKHHYVSQFYLDGIASKRDFNRITVEGKENYFEDHQSEMEDMFAPSFKMIIETKAYPSNEQLRHIQNDEVFEKVPPLD